MTDTPRNRGGTSSTPNCGTHTMPKRQRHYPGKPAGPRWGLILAIVVAHVAALYGLSRALAPDFTAGIEREVVSAFTLDAPELPEPPPPSAPPEPDAGAAGAPGEDAVPRPVTAPAAPIRPSPQPRPPVSATGTATRSGAREAGEGTGAGGEGLGTGSGASGSGRGSGIVLRPSVRSGRIDAARDFPVPAGGRETRFGRSVTVVFTVTPQGRARDCSVARTDVDAATTERACPLVTERIRFNPARNAAGEPVAARYGYLVEFRQR
ncbi:MAG: hypothetical protein V2J51_05060 [Erythrobacter sp.]|nr:hypothetical protein [Erythrobacter sp.]